jgi:hypothetical protein
MASRKTRMCFRPESLKSWLDLCAAVFAFSAAIAWFIASRHPVAKPGHSGYGTDPGEARDKQQSEMNAAGAKIDRGARWNMWAAILTGLSALAMSLSWVAEHCAMP